MFKSFDVFCWTKGHFTESVDQKGSIAMSEEVHNISKLQQ